MVNNKQLVALCILGSQQALATADTITTIHQLLDYCATYPDDGIMYLSSNMVLAAHSDVGCANKTKSRSRAGARISLLIRG